MSGYSTGWQAGLENIREEDLIICCTKSRSITQAGSELDFLLKPKATVDTGSLDRQIVLPYYHIHLGADL